MCCGMLKIQVIKGTLSRDLLQKNNASKIKMSGFMHFYDASFYKNNFVLKNTVKAV